MLGREKEEIRRAIWDRLLEAGVARPPLPPHGRIPNFESAEKAALNIRRLKVWEEAEVVKINPDSPQRPVRYGALLEGKKLLMPTPRIKRGFILLDPSLIPKSAFRFASTIRGAFVYGRMLDSISSLSQIGQVDLVVEGSVVVNRWGERLGKGEGYAELEFGILVDLGIMSREVTIITSVHELQLVNYRLPQDPYDVPVDIISTSVRVIRVNERPPRPKGILWDLLPEKKIKEIPLLEELARGRST
ncbi:MAG: 5-formyltetrahydrofolate cyclo-ligase [Desulfurococcales archaeon]|nr:5-formyltetrahydrofolate cyclo-ligase [Desulfurococcales archaeon]